MPAFGNANVNVNFNNVPKNVKVSANGQGALENIRLQRTPAMNSTGSYGTEASNAYAEE
jgi:hypothetical protein